MTGPRSVTLIAANRIGTAQGSGAPQTFYGQSLTYHHAVVDIAACYRASFRYLQLIHV